MGKKPAGSAGINQHVGAGAGGLVEGGGLMQGRTSQQAGQEKA